MRDFIEDTLTNPALVILAITAAFISLACAIDPMARVMVRMMIASMGAPLYWIGYHDAALAWGHIWGFDLD